MNLKVLSVCDNEILAIQGLEHCLLLEELLMEVCVSVCCCWKSS